MAPARAAVEVGRGGSEPDELEIDIAAGRLDVAEEAPVSVNVVERRIARELDGRADRREARELVSRAAPEALALTFGRVDLDEPDAASVRKPQRVAVRDPRHAADLRAGELFRALLRAAAREQRDRDEYEQPDPAGLDSLTHGCARPYTGDLSETATGIPREGDRRVRASDEAA